MYSVFEAWDQHITARLGAAKLSKFHAELPEGKIHVTPCSGDEYLATIHWPNDGGTRDVARATAPQILALVCDQLLFGISFPPPYQDSETAHELKCEGRIRKRVLPEGELRLIPHGGGHIGLLVLPNALRMLGWSDDLDSAYDISRRLVHVGETRRMLVRFRGRIHELRYSQVDGILAFCVDDNECILLVPGDSFFDRRGMWDTSVRVMVMRRGHDLEHVWTHPSLANLNGNDFVWSDEWPRSARSPADAVRPRASSPLDRGRDEQPRAEPNTIPCTWIDPRLRRLVCHWLDTLDHTKGDGKAARVELDRLLRDCLEKGAEDIRGCGRRLREDLERRGGFALSCSARALRYAIAYFALTCPQLFQRLGKRDTLIALSQLRPGTELARWLEETYGALEPRPEEEVEDQEEREDTAAEPPAPLRDALQGGFHAGAYCMEEIRVELDASTASPPADEQVLTPVEQVPTPAEHVPAPAEHVPTLATSEASSSASSDLPEDAGYDAPWDLNAVPPEVVASVARYLGKPNVQARAEPNLPAGPPPALHFDRSRFRLE